MSNFHALEVVSRGSEAQHQVIENLNKFTATDTFNTYHLKNDMIGLFFNHRLIDINIMVFGFSIDWTVELAYVYMVILYSATNHIWL